MALLSWQQSDRFIELVSDQRVERVDWLLGDQTDLAKYELEKLQQACLSPAYLLGLELFYDAQVGLVREVLGDEFLTSAIPDLYRTEVWRNNALVLDYAPSIQIPSRLNRKPPCRF